MCKKVKSLESRLKVIQVIDGVDEIVAKQVMVYLADKFNIALVGGEEYEDAIEIHQMKSVSKLDFTPELKEKMMNTYETDIVFYPLEGIVLMHDKKIDVTYYYDVLLGSEGLLGRKEIPEDLQPVYDLLFETIEDEVEGLTSAMQDVMDTTPMDE